MDRYESEDQTQDRTQDQTQDPAEGLTQTLEALTKDHEGDTIAVGEIMQRVRYRGFGSMLLAPALITVMPTGAIPFVPALCGVIIVFVCVQILMGRNYPWLPAQVKEFEISTEKIEKAVQSVKPYTSKIDQYLQKRLYFLLHDISKYITAAVSLALSLVMILIGFIPMLPAAVALPIFFFGLGFIARDGLIISLGYLSLAGSYLGISLIAELL